VKSNSSGEVIGPMLCICVVEYYFSPVSNSTKIIKIGQKTTVIIEKMTFFVDMVNKRNVNKFALMYLRQGESSSPEDDKRPRALPAFL